jgi:hypothetical protein
LFTALNLLPSMATTASDNSCISGTVQQSAHRPYRWQRHYPYPKVGNSLEVRHHSTSEPHELGITLRFALQPSTRLDAIEVPVDIDL